MSVDSGGGSTEGWRMPGAPGGTGQPVLVSLPETYAAYLFDYCEGILRDQGPPPKRSGRRSPSPTGRPTSSGTPAGSGSSSIPALAGSA